MESRTQPFRGNVQELQKRAQAMQRKIQMLERHPAFQEFVKFNNAMEEGKYINDLIRSELMRLQGITNQLKQVDDAREQYNEQEGNGEEPMLDTDDVSSDVYGEEEYNVPEQQPQRSAYKKPIPLPTRPAPIQPQQPSNTPRPARTNQPRMAQPRIVEKMNPPNDFNYSKNDIGVDGSDIPEDIPGMPNFSDDDERRR